MSYWKFLKNGESVFFQGDQKITFTSENKQRFFKTLWKRTGYLSNVIKDKLFILDLQTKTWTIISSEETICEGGKKSVCKMNIGAFGYGNKCEGHFDLEGKPWEWTRSTGIMNTESGPMECTTIFEEKKMIQTQKTETVSIQGEYHMIDRDTYLQFQQT